MPAPCPTWSTPRTISPPVPPIAASASSKKFWRPTSTGRLSPLYPAYVDVTRQALVVGGGLAGMTAALDLAAQGFETHLIEKNDTLGGNLRHIQYTLEGNPVQDYLAQLIDEVQRHPLIHVHTRACLGRVSGSL